MACWRALGGALTLLNIPPPVALRRVLDLYQANISQDRLPLQPGKSLTLVGVAFGQVPAYHHWPQPTCIITSSESP